MTTKKSTSSGSGAASSAAAGTAPPAGRDISSLDPAKFADIKHWGGISKISYNQHIYLNTLKMLDTRGGFDEVSDILIPAVKSHTTYETFMSAIITGTNLLRDTIMKLFVKNVKGTVSFRIMMSFLTINQAKDGYTAVFFTEVPRGKFQVSKPLINLYKASLLYLAESYPIKEIIFISPVQLSHDSKESIDQLKTGYFVQDFKDSEVYTNPTETAWTSDIVRVVKPRDVPRVIVSEFNSKDIAEVKKKLPRIYHNDIQIKYMGIRPGSIIYMMRRPLVPGGMVSRELTIVYVF